MPSPDIVTLAGGYASEAAPPAAGEFHVGLVMAGAVSAGAFTAGVIDLLVEALDAWEAAKAAERAQNPDPTTWSVPGHQVKLRIMAGASAGSITAAIAAAALHHTFPHVPTGTPYAPEPRGTWLGNPLYKAWVHDIDIRHLLGDSDLKDGMPVNSVLDSSVLDGIAASAIGYSGPRAPQRPYLASPVRYVFTLGNLRGTPYFLQLTGAGGVGLGMVAHADYVGYSVNYAGPQPSRLYLDDRMLVSPNSAQDQGWTTFAQSALSSGAFPIGLAPRSFTRDPADYQYRFALVPRTDQPGTLAQALSPTWPDNRPPATYQTMVVDGGTMNNDPLEIARIELSGYTGRNPREGDTANRAVVMIDPFPDKAGTVDDPQRGQKADIMHAALALLEAWKDQARFKPLDIALAEDDRVYSRYIVAPSRDSSAASKGFDLACGALGGFSGFLNEEYRHHDYMLGRRNCQWFLKKFFVLPVTNQGVFGAVNPKLKASGSKWLMDDKGTPSLPIIPLMDAVNAEETLPQWPTVTLDLKSLEDSLDSRFAKVIEHILKTTVHLNFIEEFGAELGLRAVRKKLIAKVLQSVAGDLQQRNLKTTGL